MFSFFFFKNLIWACCLAVIFFFRCLGCAVPFFVVVCVVVGCSAFCLLLCCQGFCCVLAGRFHFAFALACDVFFCFAGAFVWLFVMFVMFFLCLL